MKLKHFPHLYFVLFFDFWCIAVCAPTPTPTPTPDPSVSERSEVERLEDLHMRRNALAAYCKLIIHGVLEMSMAAEVFMQYVKVTVHSASTENPCFTLLEHIWTQHSASFLRISVVSNWSFHQLLTSKWASHQYRQRNQHAHLSDTSAAVISAVLDWRQRLPKEAQNSARWTTL